MVLFELKVSQLKGFRIARPRRNVYTNIARNYFEELLHWRVRLSGVKNNTGELERYAIRRVKTISIEYCLEIILPVIEGGITERN